MSLILLVLPHWFWFILLCAQKKRCQFAPFHHIQIFRSFDHIKAYPIQYVGIFKNTAFPLHFGLSSTCKFIFLGHRNQSFWKTPLSENSGFLFACMQKTFSDVILCVWHLQTFLAGPLYYSLIFRSNFTSLSLIGQHVPKPRGYIAAPLWCALDTVWWSAQDYFKITLILGPKKIFLRPYWWILWSSIDDGCVELAAV